MEQRKCVFCGEIFTVDYPSKIKKYCTDSCKKKALKRKTEFTCTCCGKVFLSSSPNAKFCSQTCGEKFRRWGQENVVRNCKNCGKEFEVSKSRKQFCSKKCSLDYFYDLQLKKKKTSNIPTYDEHKNDFMLEELMRIREKKESVKNVKKI